MVAFLDLYVFVRAIGEGRRRLE